MLPTYQAMAFIVGAGPILIASNAGIAYAGQHLTTARGLNND